MSNKRFDVIYPTSSRITLDGGKNNKFERSIIQDSESPDCLNVLCSNGAVETRGGFGKFNTTSVGSFVGDGIYTRRGDDSVETMIVFAGGGMYTLGGTSTFTSVPSATSMFTAGVRVATAQYQDHMFIGNGGITPHKWGGTYFTRHGVDAPTTTSTVASQATGVLTGGYRYKVTYVNSFSVEGSVGPTTATFTAASATLRVSNIPTAPQSFGVSARRLYRTSAGGSEWKRITEIADNTTTTYDDNNADTALGVTAPEDNGMPPNYSVVCYHANRIFCNDPANPSLVWYSNLAEPFTFSSANFIRVGDASADLVKALSVYDNSVIVSCENSQWLIYMASTDDADWQLIRLKSEFGSRSHFAHVLFNNKIFFPAVQNSRVVGFAAIEGNGVAPSATILTTSSALSNLLSERIEPDMLDIQDAYAGNISAIVYENRIWIAVTYQSGASTNNRVFVYDFSTGNLQKKLPSWIPFTFPTGMYPAQYTIYGGNLYFISSSATGFVYKFNKTTYADDGNAIDSYIWTKEFSGLNDHEGDYKDFRALVVLAEKSGDYYMDINYRADSDSGDGDVVRADLDPGSAIWNSFLWGGNTWGGGSDQQEYRLFLGKLRGRRVQFKFSNQNRVNQKFKVHGIKFGYNLKGPR